MGTKLKYLRHQMPQSHRNFVFAAREENHEPKASE
jgi:hypothetical protein